MNKTKLILIPIIVPTAVQLIIKFPQSFLQLSSYPSHGLHYYISIISPIIAIGDELEMNWRCIGDVLEMYWRCIGGTYEIPWRYP